MYMDTCIYMYIFMYLFTFMYMHTFMYTHTSMYMYTATYSEVQNHRTQAKQSWRHFVSPLLPQPATHYNTLQHTATQYNPLQHTQTSSKTVMKSFCLSTSIPTCNALQHTATHCNTHRPQAKRSWSHSASPLLPQSSPPIISPNRCVNAPKHTLSVSRSNTLTHKHMCVACTQHRVYKRDGVVCNLIGHCASSAG